MKYEEALEKINSRLIFGVRPGLERMKRLMAEMGNPQDRLKIIHVAGTNGKGTACTLISSVLRESGVKTGLYTSPYVIDFRERFIIDGKMIGKEELAEAVQAVLPFVEKIERDGDTVTEFEFITAVAFWWFANENCGAVVLEVGLGGRLDATNVVAAPEAAAIMSISLDHMNILGNTCEKIAFEKAGIIKEGGKVVMYPEQKPEVFREISKICRERRAKLIIPDLCETEVLMSDIGGSEIRYKGEKLFIPFAGKHQILNAVTAFEVLALLKESGFKIESRSIAEGFKKAFIPARMEVISKRPLILLDGGHNPGCAQALKNLLMTFEKGKKITAVVGMMADKDVRESLKITAPLFEKIISVTPKNPRAMPAEKLALIAEEFCKNVVPAGSCKEALELAVKGLSADSALVVCGSFYLAAEMRGQLKEKTEKLRLA